MKLSKNELRCVLAIGSVVALRLLGIFIIIPVFSVYAVNYEGATVASAGVAFGIYALTQSLLQIPFGLASDRFGRKPVIVAGLLIFCVGSVLCAFADNIWELILTRALQGSGAIGSVAIAALGDSTRSEVRAQSFMVTGIIVGAAFIISLVAGPALAAEFGFESLFFVLAALGFTAIFVTLAMFPKLPKKKSGKRRELFFKLREPEVVKLLSATFVTSLALNLLFFIYPLNWKNLGTEPGELWLIYLIILSPSVLFVYPYIRVSEKKKKMRPATRLGFFLIAAAFLFYLFRPPDSVTLYLAGTLFFLGHSMFQSMLPAFLTQRISSENRGTLSGFFNLANFLGACIGGMSSGALYQTHESLPLVFGLFFMALWKLVGLPNPPLERAETE